MSTDNLKDVYLDQLQDLHSANKQSAKVVGQLAEAASNSELVDALNRGKSGIVEGMEAMALLIGNHDGSPGEEHCKGMEGLVKEAQAHALNEEFGDDDARDAMIITQYQRMVHYAIAGYGCLAAFAKRLGLEEEQKTLQGCLDACYEGDRVMSKLAETDINPAAV